MRHVDEGGDVLPGDETGSLAPVAQDAHLEPTAERGRRRDETAGPGREARLGDERAARELRDHRRRRRGTLAHRREDDGHDRVPSVLRELVERRARAPTEVEILSLHVAPVPFRPEDAHVLAPVRLIDELGVVTRGRAKIDEGLANDRPVRPGHRHLRGGPY